MSIAGLQRVLTTAELQFCAVSVPVQLFPAEPGNDELATTNWQRRTGNDELATKYVEKVYADPSYTIGAVAITPSTSIDGLVESMLELSRYLKAPIYVSTSDTDRSRGGIKVVRILETYRISGGDGGQGSCINTATGESCL